MMGTWSARSLLLGAFVEIQRLATLEDFYSGHSDFDEGRIELDARTAGGSEDAAPIGVATGECCFYERRRGNCLGDFLCGGFGFGAADFNFNDTLSAFTVGNDLLC